MPSFNSTRAGAPTSALGKGRCHHVVAKQQSHFLSRPTRIPSTLGSCKSIQSNLISKSLLPPSHSRLFATVTAGTSDLAVDVCVIGAGIIGLTAAATLLESDPDITVLLLDRYEPCSNATGSATGAGQGYIWLAHRDPSSVVAWELAARSKLLLEKSLKSACSSQDLLSANNVEWQNVGSMLLATTADEAATLHTREHALRTIGVGATFIDAAAARSLEPSVHIPDDGGALVTPGDSQLNGRRTAAAVLELCKAHGPRFSASFYEGVEGLNFTANGKVCGVVSEKRTITVHKNVVLASGAWAGEFLAQQLSQPEWAAALRPRRGLLLEMPRPREMPPLTRGLMEMGYTKHYSVAGKAAAAAAAAAEASVAQSGGVGQEMVAPDITFTATTSASGPLLVGSSREFSSWEVDAAPEVVESIMSRAIDFLPGLSGVDQKSISVRVGLRPFAPGGPMVGPVPGVEGLVLASGHEGSGLTLSKATGELIADYILNRNHALSDAAVASLLPKLPS